VIWLDGLDIPLVRNLEANWASTMKPASAPSTETDSSQDEFTAAGLVPRQSRYEETGYPQVRWPWRTVRAALEALAATAPRRASVVLRHVNPRTGRYPLKTMGSEARWLRPGEETRAERRTGSEVVYVIEGQGESRIGNRVLDWQAGDAFAVPPWQWVEHHNRSGAAPACLFHLNDEPALRALGLWHEEGGA
jgi:gentisate 1,2-dioxygenase